MNRTLALLAGLLLLLDVGVCEAQAPAGAGAKPGAPRPAVGYMPPVRGAPSRRVGGSSRGVEDDLPNVVVLVPDHVGLTAREQPTLYWFLSKPTPIRIEFTLIDTTRVEPLVEIPAGRDLPAGIHAIRLADHGVRLRPDVEYEWSIALVLNPDERSHDIISAGAIMRVQPTAAQLARLGGAGAGEAGLVYAEQGIWYDAIEAMAGDDLRPQRAALLRQVGLDEPAAFEARLPGAGARDGAAR